MGKIHEALRLVADGAMEFEPWKLIAAVFGMPEASGRESLEEKAPSRSMGFLNLSGFKCPSPEDPDPKDTNKGVALTPVQQVLKDLSI